MSSNPLEAGAPAKQEIRIQTPDRINYMGIRECAQYYRGEEFNLAGSMTSDHDAETKARQMNMLTEKIISATPGTDPIVQLEIRAGTTHQDRDFLTMQKLFEGYLVGLAQSAYEQGYNLETTVHGVFGDKPKTIKRMHDVERPDILNKQKTFLSFQDAPADSFKPTLHLEVSVDRELYSGGTWGSQGGGGAFIGYKLNLVVVSKENGVESF